MPRGCELRLSSAGSVGDGAHLFRRQGRAALPDVRKRIVDALAEPVGDAPEKFGAFCVAARVGLPDPEVLTIVDAERQKEGSTPRKLTLDEICVAIWPP